MFCYIKDLIFELKRKVEKGERNDKMTRKTKSKAFLNLISWSQSKSEKVSYEWKLLEMTQWVIMRDI